MIYAKTKILFKTAFWNGIYFSSLKKPKFANIQRYLIFLLFYLITKDLVLYL